MTTNAKAKKTSRNIFPSVSISIPIRPPSWTERQVGKTGRFEEREREREGEKQKTALTTDGSETSHRTYWTMASHRNATSRRPFFFSFFFFFSSPPWERADRIEKKKDRNSNRWCDPSDDGLGPTSFPRVTKKNTPNQVVVVDNFIRPSRISTASRRTEKENQ